MKKSVKDLCDFIQDHKGPEDITPEDVEEYLKKVKAYLAMNEGNKDWNLYVLSLSMLSSFANSGYCTINEPIGPSLDIVQKCAKEYLEESEGEEWKDVSAFSFGKEETVESELFPGGNIEHLFNTFPQNSYLPNNEFSREMAKGALINAGKQTVTFDKKHDSSAEFEVTRPENSGNLTIYGKHDYFDNAVTNGIDAIYKEEEDHFFTLQHLYRVINHDPDAKASEKELQAMQESLEAQRVTRCEGNIEKLKADAERRGMDVSELPDVVDDMLIDVRGGYKEAGGYKVPVYYVKERPLPCILGELTGQEIKIPAKCFCVKKVDSKGKLGTTINKNRDRIAITEYIVERIYAMKNDNSLAHKKKRDYDYKRKKSKKLPERSLEYFRTLKSDAILYDSIFEAAGCKDVHRNTLTRHKAYIKQCLEYLQAIGEIKGFTLICTKRKKCVDKVRILLE